MLVANGLLRGRSAPCLGLAVVTRAWLAVGGRFCRLTVAGQAGFYGLALLGLLAERAALPVGKLAVPYYFCVVSAAGIGGFARYLRGGGEAVWSPRGQASVKDRAA